MFPLSFGSCGPPSLGFQKRGAPPPPVMLHLALSFIIDAEAQWTRHNVVVENAKRPVLV